MGLSEVMGFGKGNTIEVVEITFKNYTFRRVSWWKELLIGV
jgi:hypothetical protein